LPRSARRFWVPLVLAVVAAAPDLDVVAFRLGIPYAHPLGHRGLSHSLVFAALVALVSFPLWRLAKLEPARLAAVLTGCAVASHGLLDTFTDAGLGVGLLIPLTDARIFSPFRPLMTSPLSARAFFSQRGLGILANELCWIGPVAVLIVGGGVAARRVAATRR
jgi:inner membrane protein